MYLLMLIESIKKEELNASIVEMDTVVGYCIMTLCLKKYKLMLMFLIKKYKIKVDYFVDCFVKCFHFAYNNQ